MQNRQLPSRGNTCVTLTKYNPIRMLFTGKIRLTLARRQLFNSTATVVFFGSVEMILAAIVKLIFLVR